MLEKVSPASAHQSSLQTSLKWRMQLWEVILLPGFVSFGSFTAHLRCCCNEQAKKQNRDSHLTPAALGGHQEHWGPGRTFHSLSSWPEENGPYLPLVDLTKGETNPEEVLLLSYRTRWDEWLIIHWNLKRMVSVRSEWIKERNTKQKGHVSFIRKLRDGMFCSTVENQSLCFHSWVLDEKKPGLDAKNFQGMLAEKRLSGARSPWFLHVAWEASWFRGAYQHILPSY